MGHDSKAILKDIHKADPKPEKKLTPNSNLDMLNAQADSLLTDEQYNGAKAFFDLAVEAFELSPKPLLPRGKIDIMPEVFSDSIKSFSEALNVNVPTVGDRKIGSSLKKLLVSSKLGNTYANVILRFLNVSINLKGVPTIDRDFALPQDMKKLMGVIKDNNDAANVLRSINHALYIKDHPENPTEINRLELRKESFENLSHIIKPAVDEYKKLPLSSNLQIGLSPYAVNAVIGLVNQNLSTKSTKFSIQKMPIPKNIEDKSMESSLEKGQSSLQQAVQDFKSKGISGILSKLAGNVFGKAVGAAMGESISVVATELERFTEDEAQKLTNNDIMNVIKAGHTEFQKYSTVELLEKAWADGDKINPDEKSAQPEKTNKNKLDERDENFIDGLASKVGTACNGIDFKKYLDSISRSAGGFLETLSRQTYIKTGYKMTLADWDRNQDYIVSKDWDGFKAFRSSERSARNVDSDNIRIIQQNRRLCGIDGYLRSLKFAKQAEKLDSYGNKMIGEAEFLQKYPDFADVEYVRKFVDFVIQNNDTGTIDLSSYGGSDVQFISDEVLSVYETIQRDFDNIYAKNKSLIYQNAWVLLEDKNQESSDERVESENAKANEIIENIKALFTNLGDKISIPNFGDLVVINKPLLDSLDEDNFFDGDLMEMVYVSKINASKEFLPVWKELNDAKMLEIAVAPANKSVHAMFKKFYERCADVSLEDNYDEVIKRMESSYKDLYALVKKIYTISFQKYLNINQNETEQKDQQQTVTANQTEPAEQQAVSTEQAPVQESIKSVANYLFNFR